MSELEPRHIAALRQLREEKIAELRKQGRAFSPAEVEQMVVEFEKLHGPLPRAQKQPETTSAGVGLFAKWRGLLLKLAVPAAAVLVVGLIVWSSLTPAGIVFPADPSERGIGDGGKPVLPDHIRVDFDKQRIEFFGGGDKLTGSMTEVGAESSPDVQAYQVTVKGKDDKGLEGAFDGRALFTRAKRGAPIRQKVDVKKIEVRGNLRISGLGSFPVKRTYLP